MRKIILYSDGSLVKGNVGGYGCVLIDEELSLIKQISGSQLDSTNNQMELLAVIKGMEALLHPCEVHVYSDSRYVVDTFRLGWIYGWIQKDWRSSTNNPIKNKVLWVRLLQLTQIHSTEFHWVKGHDGNKYNDKADYLANSAARGIKDENSEELPLL